MSKDIKAGRSQAEKKQASKWLCIRQTQPLKRSHYPLASVANVKMTKDTQWAGHGKQVLAWRYWVHRLLHTQLSNTCRWQWYKPHQEFPFWETALTICFSLHNMTYKCPLGKRLATQSMTSPHWWHGAAVSTWTRNSSHTCKINIYIIQDETRSICVKKEKMPTCKI